MICDRDSEQKLEPVLLPKLASIIELSQAIVNSGGALLFASVV
jgi:hypothetical protein